VLLGAGSPSAHEHSDSAFQDVRRYNLSQDAQSIKEERKTMFARIQPNMNILVTALLLSSAAVAQTHIPATGLCNTGLTPASPLPTGCTTSTLVTPVNPASGGSSVDGNWQLATPYPSASWNQQAPDPCSLTTFGPAWIDAPANGWFDPKDGLSQWITPLSDANTTGGWYIYRTAFPIPSIASGSTKYVLTVTGQLMADDELSAIILERTLENSAQHCSGLALPSLTSVPGEAGAQYAWNNFHFAATVLPNTSAYLYFILYNIPFPNGNTGNYTGLRVEFTSANLTPPD
jgi:hypothetical protein